MSQFPQTSVTLFAKIKELGSGDDSAAWVRFWDMYEPAIRRFAAQKCGEQKAEDIVMIVLGKLIDCLRSGQYTPEKGRFRSYLATMIVNEIHMAHRKDTVRRADRHISLDAPIGDDEDGRAFSERLVAPAEPVENIDEDWRRAVLESAREHVLTQTALSDRDRQVYRAYAIDGEDIAAVAARFGISRNYVSQIKTRIDKRIVATGREMIEGEF